MARTWCAPYRSTIATPRPAWTRPSARAAPEYNHSTADPENKPNPCLRPIEHAPYFAVAVYPSTMGTCVGLATDGDARVLDGRGEPIGGLYSVGNDMASLFRGVYVG